MLPVAPAPPAASRYQRRLATVDGRCGSISLLEQPPGGGVPPVACARFGHTAILVGVHARPIIADKRRRPSRARRRETRRPYCARRAPRAAATRRLGRHDLPGHRWSRLYRQQSRAGACRRRRLRARRRRPRARPRRPRRPARRGRRRPAARCRRSTSPAVADLLEGVDAVFNVAGQVSHSASMRDPHSDLQLNAVSHRRCSTPSDACSPAARSSTPPPARCTAGNDADVVDETPSRPPGRRQRRRQARRRAAPPGVLPRLRHPSHGPSAHQHLRARQRLTSDELGFLPVFMRKALTGETIEIYGDGQATPRLPARR